jgi:uncharacterized protein
MSARHERVDSSYADAGRPVAPRQSRLRPLGVDEVRITGGFWGQRQQVNGSATLAHNLAWTERVGWLGNFRAAYERRLPTDRSGRVFADSEIYKLAEAMAWETVRSADSTVSETLDRLATEVIQAQESDGYLNTAFGRPGQPARYSDLEWGHELYCYGHLIQAGVADARARGNGSGGFLEIATRAADHVCATFGPDGNDGFCGHPGIEMALVELARLTGQQRYLDQAASFVDRRGRGRLAEIEFGRAYFQDDMPVRDAHVLRGHAVRALYLAAGAVDVAVETGDEALLESIIRQWEATVARRTYLTGGMGSHHLDESFGDDFVLPPDRAYSETCAGVASVMLGWRLLLATGDPRYADLIERTLFNVVATSPAADGRAFFYANTLHQRHRGNGLPPGAFSPRPQASPRAPWFAVSCCPMNVARTLASLSAYIATVDADGLQIHQYADADIRTTLGNGQPIAVRMRTDYPDGGAVTIEVTQAPSEWTTIRLRVPHWARGQAVLTPPGEAARTAPDGQAEITRVFAVGDRIRLELPVVPRWTFPDARIDAVRGAVAVERGPIVLCLESVDLPGGADVDAVWVDPAQAPLDRDDAVVVAGALTEPASSAAWPYGDAPRASHGSSGDLAIQLRPYHSWAERGPSTMRVWLPRKEHVS